MGYSQSVLVVAPRGQNLLNQLKEQETCRRHMHVRSIDSDHNRIWIEFGRVFQPRTLTLQTRYCLLWLHGHGYVGLHPITRTSFSLLSIAQTWSVCYMPSYTAEMTQSFADLLWLGNDIIVS